MSQSPPAMPLSSITTVKIAGKDVALSDDQSEALQAMTRFILDPKASVFVLEGHAGTGKTTLTQAFIEQLPKTIKMLKALQTPSSIIDNLRLYLTATTNKACEAFSDITGYDVTTIHSLLSLKVQTDFRTSETSLSYGQGFEPILNAIVIIDEASFCDSSLLGAIHERLPTCKILFILDPAQLVHFKTLIAPVITQGYTTVQLTKVVRQAEGNPIIKLAEGFRNVVYGAPWFKFQPDRNHIQHHSRDEFERIMMADFDRGPLDVPWHANDSKLLAWTNKTVIAYNQAIHRAISGSPSLTIGDYVVCNNYISNNRCRLKTDQQVRITGMQPWQAHGLQGFYYTLDNRYEAFMPNDRDEWKSLLKRLQANEDYHDIRDIKTSWIDLRAAYACTVNKSQGSTYDRVYIDLDDIARCNNYNQLARMLYTAVSRARHQVFFTGDFTN